MDGYNTSNIVLGKPAEWTPETLNDEIKTLDAILMNFFAPNSCQQSVSNKIWKIIPIIWAEFGRTELGLSSKFLCSQIKIHIQIIGIRW